MESDRNSCNCLWKVIETHVTSWKVINRTVPSKGIFNWEIWVSHSGFLRIQFSGMLHFFGRVVPDVSEDRNAFIFSASSLLPALTLKMKALRFSETSGTIHITTQLHMPKDLHLKLWITLANFSEFSKIKFHENAFRYSRVASRLQKDAWTDVRNNFKTLSTWL